MRKKQEGLISLLKKGKVPVWLEKIAKEEGVDLNLLVEKVLNGRVVIPKNLFREVFQPCAIGEGMKVKVNANIGTSEKYCELNEELKKLNVAVSAGADTVMDLSTGGNISLIRKKIIESSPIPVGTVPIYEAALKAKEEYGNVVHMTKEDFMNAVLEQAKSGVDFMTIHAGITVVGMEALKKMPRLLGVVSRGGSFTIAWMLHNDSENPYFEYFDEVLEILRDYDVTLSLGDGLRPGCIKDATDAAQITELLKIGELVKRARKADVQVMVEGPGHVPLSEIETNVRLEKAICDGAPFYVLGPLPTDSAPGYDHIVSAIGGALAAYHGADYLCYVTPREHLGLPTVQDVYEGVMVSKIAAHIADVARGRKNSVARDEEMAKARAELDWKTQIEISLDSEKMKNLLEERSSLSGPCTMCGELCAIDIVSKHMEKEGKKEC